MKIKVHLSIGLAGCAREDEIEIDDEALEGLDAEGRGEVFEEYLKDWVSTYLEYSYTEEAPVGACPKCHQTYDGGITWPVTVKGTTVEGGCQACWETECAESWWAAQPALAALNMTTKEGTPMKWGD